MRVMQYWRFNSVGNRLRVETRASLRIQDAAHDPRYDHVTGRIHAVRSEDDIDLEEMWEDGYGAR